jgi:hypothetical protein
MSSKTFGFEFLENASARCPDTVLKAQKNGEDQLDAPLP